ncbi:MAG: Protein yceI precursor, partial [uncultured Gemmatimonadetes bacterium]
AGSWDDGGGDGSGADAVGRGGRGARGRGAAGGRRGGAGQVADRHVALGAHVPHPAPGQPRERAVQPVERHHRGRPGQPGGRIGGGRHPDGQHRHQQRAARHAPSLRRLLRRAQPPHHHLPQHPRGGGWARAARARQPHHPWRHPARGAGGRDDGGKRRAGQAAHRLRGADHHRPHGLRRHLEPRGRGGRRGPGRRGSHQHRRLRGGTAV